MRAFITGMAGFAGSHLAEHCLASGDEVLGSSLSGDWGEQRVAARLPAELRTGAKLLRWDISAPLDAATFAALTEFAPDVIYHLAAVSKAADCDEDRRLAEEVNVAGTQHVLDLAARLPARPRVVFVSSSYVYAQQRSESQGQRVKEDVPLYSPSAPGNGGYAATKLAGEARVQEFVQSQGGDAVIARAFQHAGPRQSPRFMLAQWCEHFARRDGSPVAIRKSHAYIDLSDVRDVVRAYRLLAERGKCGEIYNVGSGRDVRTGELFERLRSVADAARPFTVGDEAVVYTPVADISRITAATGWRPEIPIERTIEDTYRWFCE